MVNYKDIDIEAPLSSVFVAHNYGFAVFIISLAALAGLTSVNIVMLLGQSRVFYAMAKDGLLPKSIFGVLHPKFKTPYKSTILTGLIVALISAIFPIEDIAKLVNIGTLLAFIMVSAAVWIMRKKEPDLKRPFKTPWISIVAPLSILFNLGLMLGLEWINWLRLLIWLAIGLLIYWFYSRKNSVLGKTLKE